MPTPEQVETLRALVSQQGYHWEYGDAIARQMPEGMPFTPETVREAAMAAGASPALAGTIASHLNSGTDKAEAPAKPKRKYAKKAKE